MYRSLPTRTTQIVVARPRAPSSWSGAICTLSAALIAISSSARQPVINDVLVDRGLTALAQRLEALPHRLAGAIPQCDEAVPHGPRFRTTGCHGRGRRRPPEQVQTRAPRRLGEAGR